MQSSRRQTVSTKVYPNTAVLWRTLWHAWSCMCAHGCSFDNVPDRSVVRQQGWVGQASHSAHHSPQAQSSNSIGYAQCTKSQRIRCLIAPSTACPATCSSSSGCHNVRCSTVQRAMQHSTTCDALRNSGCACGRRAPLQQMGCARLPLNAIACPKPVRQGMFGS